MIAKVNKQMRKMDPFTKCLLLVAIGTAVMILAALVM
jgi:hypothetical protein